VALASGAVGRRHISVFHRFFSRAIWALDDLGRALFGLAVAWIPAEQLPYLVIDDTLTRKSGKGVALALWVPLPRMRRAAQSSRGRKAAKS
jgi:hypothetical protein